MIKIKINLKDGFHIMLGLAVGLALGVTLTISWLGWGAAQIVDHLEIKNVEVGFNETLMVEKMFELIKEEYPSYEHQKINDSGLEP